MLTRPFSIVSSCNNHAKKKKISTLFFFPVKANYITKAREGKRRHDFSSQVINFFFSWILWDCLSIRGFGNVGFRGLWIDGSEGNWRARDRDLIVLYNIIKHSHSQLIIHKFVAPTTCNNCNCLHVIVPATKVSHAISFCKLLAQFFSAVH